MIYTFVSGTQLIVCLDFVRSHQAGMATVSAFTTCGFLFLAYVSRRKET